jgi:hypothetical protein
MQLLRLDEVPQQRAIKTFRYSLWPALNMAIILLAITGGQYYFIAYKDAPAFLWIFIVFTALIALFCINLARAGLRKKTNWLIRYTTDGLYVKFRSYQNYRIPDDTSSVVFIPNNEIDRIRIVDEKLRVPNSEYGAAQINDKFLDLVLHNVSLEALEKALQQERRIMPPARFGVSSRSEDFPVRVIEPDTVRIKWQAKPNVKKAAATFEKMFPVEHAGTDNRGNWDSMRAPEKETLIIELAQRGETLRATQLARQHYGYSLKEAREYIKEVNGEN